MDDAKARPARSASVSFSSGNRRFSLFPPLSDHGMPKSPSPRSPDGSLQPHRLSGHGLPSSPRPSEPLSPMSPPMSARSFGTFIDSEPSTPAYSPRTGSSWDSSTLVLLSPVPSTPRTPAEPMWEMMVPIQKAPKRRPTRFSRTASLSRKFTFDEKEISIDTSLGSHPVKHIRSQSEKEIYTGTGDLIEEESDQEVEEKQSPPQAQSAPLDRLAVKVKSLLRRKSDTDKKTQKKSKGYDDLQRMETAHWSEL